MQAIFSYIKEQLRDYYPESEIKSFYYLIMKSVCRLDKQSVLLGKDTQISPDEKRFIEKIIEDLKKFRPIQYILGETEFYGYKFKVNEQVLIPRPETEELVERVLTFARHCEGEARSNLPPPQPLPTKGGELDCFTPFAMTKNSASHRVLDVGTGSGCIAVILAKFLTGAEVYATDISEKALEVALENALDNQVTVQFIRHDIFEDWPEYLPERWDIIVSNPPYVTPGEKKIMSKNVLDYEPHQALFVPMENPLLFYERIADISLEHLKENGRLYFETSAVHGKEAMEMLKEKGFGNVRLFQDMAGRDRVLTACKVFNPSLRTE